MPGLPLGIFKSGVVYYPFGLTFNSYETENSLKQRYKYNGKELQNELNLGWYDYGARMYTPETGRWSMIDPLSELGKNYSPYNYTFGNPVRFADPSGMWPDNGTLGADGITNSQWIESSRPGADPNLASQYRNENRQKESEEKRRKARIEVGRPMEVERGDKEAQQAGPGPGIDYGNFVDPASLNLNQLGPYYQTNANYSERYWKGIPRPGYMKVTVSNIGIMITPRDSDWDAAKVQQQVAKAFDFARGSLYYAFKAGEVNSTNASASFIEFLNLGIEIHVGFGRAVPGLTLSAPVSNITFKGFWAVPSLN